MVVRPIVPARQARIDVYRGGTPRDLFRIFGLVPIDPEAADPISNIIYHNGQDYALTQPPTGEFVEQLRVLCAPVVQAFDIGVEFTP
ncbi:MAG TPA: hypothetical protein VLH84_02015 [Patescibacteria group bacterium]|nr:hypothetical protein [Patescibacteria group bacterium]